jgi:hypothetical protein
MGNFIYIDRYKSMNIEQLLEEVRRLKNLKEYDDAKTEKLQYLAKEILIKA